MKCVADIVKLAHEKFKDAQCLFNDKRYDGAYYIAGYVIELYLKAKVCKTLGIENFFDFDDPSRKKQFKNDNNINRAFKIHDLEQLLVLSGIYTIFINDLDSYKVTDLKTAWSIILNWNETARYSLGKTLKQVTDLLTAIKIFEQWIQQHL